MSDKRTHLEEHHASQAAKPVHADHARQDSQSTPIAVPYYPQLKPIAGSVLGALVISYLEMRHPAPQDSQQRRVSLPVSVDFDRMAQELNVSRRTLGLSFTQVGRWHESDLKRLSEVRSGREFLAHKHTRYAAHKLYSFVGPKRFCQPQQKIGEVTVRRNVPLMAQTQEQCGLSDIQRRPNVPIAAPAHHVLTGGGANGSGVSKSFADLILSGVALAQDRRKTRYSRLRKAVKNGLVAPDPAKVCRQQETEAVDPELAAIAERLAARSR